MSTFLIIFLVVYGIVLITAIIITMYYRNDYSNFIRHKAKTCSFEEIEKILAFDKKILNHPQIYNQAFVDATWEHFNMWEEIKKTKKEKAA